MEKKYVKIIENDLKKNLTIKRIIFNILFVLIIIFYQDFFSDLIYKYLTPEVFFSNLFVSILFIFLITFLFIVISFKLLKNKYNCSINEINLLILSFFSIYSFNFLTPSIKWEIVNIELLNLKFSYISLILFFIIITLFLVFKRYLLVLGENKKIDTSANILLDDNPISKLKDDKLDNLIIIDNLVKILKNDNHKKSFTIGLVGPWGNGKSSILNLAKKKLGKEKNSDLIIFDFLPYLNHKENDIINEFFTCLSNELKPYNSKLSDLINEYSNKITELYESKNLVGFIEEHVTDFNSSSASELYELINEMLYDVNKKIIVFIDDLDRLNKNEILQVFKLIRNTADFRNTFFVVAMDKEYVLKSLKKSKKIFHSNFIDKFFQLEIYLPEIDKNKLKDVFIKDIMKTNLNDGSPLFETQVKEAIDNPDNLFNDYIHNIRDVKRTVNQIAYDFQYMGGEIDFKDYFNFIYFKLKFPNFVKIINQGIGDFIDVNNEGLFELITKEDSDKSEEKSSDRIYNFLNKKYKFNPKGYKIYSENLLDNCLLEETLDCENKFLLIKTLAYLFGKENNLNNVDSIKYENNLRILLEQKVYENRLLNKEFELLINSNILEIFKLVDEFYKQNKIDQLMSRFEFFNSSKNIEQYKNSILVLVYIFEKRKYFNLSESKIFDQILTFTLKITNQKDGFNEYIGSWYLNNIFKNEQFNVETRLLLLGYYKKITIDINIESNNIIIKELNIEDLIIELFEEYINTVAIHINKGYDYSLFHVFHKIKQDNEEKLIKIIKEFWKESNLELLCTQITDFDSWSIFSFKISNVVEEFFGSKLNFIDFVESHKDSSKMEILEFLALYNFLEISNFQYSTMFTFKKSKLMIEKIENQKQYKSDYDENKNKIQLVLKTNSFNIINILEKNNFKNSYHQRFQNYKNSYYIFSFLDFSQNENIILKYTNDLYNVLKLDLINEYEYLEKNHDEAKIIIKQKNGDEYISIYSIEPKKNI